MSAINRFSPAQLDALKRGRAIPFLIEHRDSECPGHTLWVIATLDDEKFCGLLLPDADPDCELVEIPVEARLLAEPHPIQSDAWDAHAIHLPWSDWDAGMRDAYLDFFRQIGRALARNRLIQALRWSDSRANKLPGCDVFFMSGASDCETWRRAWPCRCDSASLRRDSDRLTEARP